jgi:hypothetical protein
VGYVQVGGEVLDVFAGGFHTCARFLGANDQVDVRCWGLNSYGQLGYGHLEAIGDDESPGSVDPLRVRPPQ